MYQVLPSHRLDQEFFLSNSGLISKKQKNCVSDFLRNPTFGISSCFQTGFNTPAASILWWPPVQPLDLPTSREMASLRLDRRTGQTYLEREMVPLPPNGPSWVHETPYLPEGWESTSRVGAPTLKHAAMKQTLSNQRNLVPELFANVPWPIASYLWDCLGRRCVSFLSFILLVKSEDARGFSCSGGGLICD